MTPLQVSGDPFQNDVLQALNPLVDELEVRRLAKVTTRADEETVTLDLTPRSPAGAMIRVEMHEWETVVVTIGADNLLLEIAGSPQPEVISEAVTIVRSVVTSGAETWVPRGERGWRARGLIVIKTPRGKVRVTNNATPLAWFCRRRWSYRAYSPYEAVEA